ncbi:Hsp70 family protein, partial [Candidatus Riflebacteria bacterium]
MGKDLAIGIDLGTSNCALATTDGDGKKGLQIAQTDGANRVAAMSTLASSIFIPQTGQFEEGALQLPWGDSNERHIVGAFARQAGVDSPQRLVHSAKSWLCYRGADPAKPILPWESEADVEKMSPVMASSAFLGHLHSALGHYLRENGSEFDKERAQVIITVPASFDEAARNLTLHAAVNAGWGSEPILLEEPQAAFYSWINNHADSWRKLVRAGDIVLVCDVGGGTTDFSLIAVVDRDGDLELERVSVGKHILLGGDNMDLALAFTLRQQLEDEKKPITDYQFQSLVHHCRVAKEQLFENPELDEVKVAVASRGSGLMKGSVSTKLTRGLLNGVVCDGFFARTGAGELPQTAEATGLQEFGLPYATDPVITKHLAGFLTRSLANIRASESLSALFSDKPDGFSSEIIIPDAVLFNGGVFKAEPLRERMLEILRQWADGGDVRELSGTDPDQAVARGASQYGWQRISGKGVRIRAGVARSYYIGLAASMPAIPGYRPPVKAVCIAPQ